MPLEKEILWDQLTCVSSLYKALVVSILLYGCTTWTLTKQLEKKLDRNYTRMLRAILNKSWRQHPTRHQLYGHLPPITKTIQVRRTRHAGHCWRSKDELVSDVLPWTPTYGQAKAGRPARTYIQQLCEDTGCNPEDLLEAMNDREKWREMVRDISAGGTTWWWWIVLLITSDFCHCNIWAVFYNYWKNILWYDQQGFLKIDFSKVNCLKMISDWLPNLKTSIILVLIFKLRKSLNKFPDYFRMGTFIDITHMKL